MLRDRNSIKFCKIFSPKWLPPWHVLTLKHIKCLHKDGNINIFVSIRLILQQLLKQKTALCIRSMTFVYCLHFEIFLLTANSNAWRHLSCIMPIWFKDICPFHFRRWRGHCSWTGKEGESKQVTAVHSGEEGEIPSLPTDWWCTLW